MVPYRKTKSSGTGIPDPSCPQGRRLGMCPEDSLMSDLYEFLKKGETRKMEDGSLELRFDKSRLMFILDDAESLEGCCVFIE
ncbi:hypothetical protein CEXT_267031 [Caerostris extrusa]|uniref:Uncharacterized protein n=1 Tax=Caerostris extrusa TaxID=172846 RepID=A0AAV4V7T4_CAEEX|nr:hypothetical protein CEXT_267031 [Caerostris extrusa]